MFHLSYEHEKIALSNLALCTNCQSYALQYRIRVNMSIFSQPGLAPGLVVCVVCVVCVCPTIIKLGQMIEEGLCITLFKGC